MSARQHRCARLIASHEADRQDLYKIGRASLKFFQRLSVWLFPHGKWSKVLMRWARSNMKRWAHDYATDIERRRREAEAFRAAQKRIRKRRLRRKMELAAKAKDSLEVIKQ